MLGDGALLTQAPGYALRVGPTNSTPRASSGSCEEARREGRRAAARAALSEALALWRGPPLADFAYEPFAQDEIGRLDELRLAALEDRIEADLALGRHEERGRRARGARRASTRCASACAGQLLLALYRCGRQAEALEAYRTARRRSSTSWESSPARS